jgi:hypothetical protein
LNDRLVESMTEFDQLKVPSTVVHEEKENFRSASVTDLPISLLLGRSLSQMGLIPLSQNPTTTLPPCVFSIISGRGADNVKKGQAPTQIGGDINIFGDDLSLLVGILPLHDRPFSDSVFGDTIL